MLLSKKLHEAVTARSVDRSIDLSTAERDDHSVVCVATAVCKDCQQQPCAQAQQPIRRFDPFQLKDPQVVAGFRAKLARFDRACAVDDVDAALSERVAHVQKCVGVFESGGRKLRKSWLSEAT